MYLGTYANLASCQNAIYEILAVKANPTGQRLPEVEKSIQAQLAVNRSFACIPVKKD